MLFQVRQMLREDAEQLQPLFERFALEHVGPLTRDIKFFRRAARKKDGLRWVALDEKEQVVGYIIASYNKRRKTGKINELVADSKYDFSLVSKLLVDKVQSVFASKGASIIRVSTMRNPMYSKIFPELGFFKAETHGLFMMAVNNVPRFVHEIKPIIASRLKRAQDWNGILELRCDKSSIYLKKAGEEVQQIEWTNLDVDYKITMRADTLSRILLGAIESREALKDGRIKVESSLPEDKAKELMALLFPKHQFLAANFW